MNEESAFDLNSSFDFMVFFQRLFTEDFMPHGHCYFWRPEILWLNVFSDAIIALAYYLIPVSLIYFVLKRRDTPFHWMFLMFGAFILLCGTTHVVEIFTTWIPIYRFEGIVKSVTAIVSLITAILLIPLMPRAIALPRMESVIKELLDNKKELEDTNKDLERFNRASMGREQRIIELKRQVNGLSKELGRNSPYDIT